jgi:hypothetical protein
VRPDVHSALAQLRKEIDVLHASIVAKSRFAAPEVMTSQRISIGSDRAVVRTLDPPTVAAPTLAPPSILSAQQRIDESERIAVPAFTTTKRGLLQRLIAFARRLLRKLAPSP